MYKERKKEINMLYLELIDMQSDKGDSITTVLHK
jgi:hypothetical protein